MEDVEFINEQNQLCGTLDITPTDQDQTLQKSEPNYLYPELGNFTIPQKAVVLLTSGRMGNQFFQYSAAYSLAKQTGSPLYLFNQNCAACKLSSDPSQDVNYYLTQFNLSKDTIIIPYTNETSPLLKAFYNYYPDIVKCYKTTSTPAQVQKLNGEYIYSEQLFNKAAKHKGEKIFVMNSHNEIPRLFDQFYHELVEQFVIPNFDTSNIDDLLQQVQQENSICINVRGKEYTKTRYYVPIDYQKSAIKFIESEQLVQNPKYFAITDDIPLAKDGLKEYPDIYYIENKTSLEMLHILSHCKNNIMTYSSFSWWGSYLNQQSNFTIVPCKYYDLYKENHITYKIQFPINNKDACNHKFKTFNYAMQYKNANGKNIEVYANSHQ